MTAHIHAVKTDYAAACVHGSSGGINAAGFTGFFAQTAIFARAFFYAGAQHRKPAEKSEECTHRAYRCTPQAALAPRKHTNKGKGGHGSRKGSKALLPQHGRGYIVIASPL